jgi:hypothetical protein
LTVPRAPGPTPGRSAAPQLKRALAALALALFVSPQAFLSALASVHKEAGVVSDDVCGDGQVRMVRMEGGGFKATSHFIRLKDRRYGVELDLFPAADPHQSRKFFAMIGPAICTLRAVESAYLRAFGDKTGDPGTIRKTIKLEHITAGAHERSTYTGVVNQVSLGYNLFRTYVPYGYHKSVNLYTPLSWAMTLVHEAQHKEQNRKGLSNPSLDRPSAPMEFHAVLYEVLFLEQFPRALVAAPDRANFSALQDMHADYLLYGSALYPWYDPAKSAKDNICHFEIGFLEKAAGRKDLVNRGFTRDPMCR